MVPPTLTRRDIANQAMLTINENHEMRNAISGE